MSITENFAMPSALEVNEDTATSRYAYFTALPWEKGFGNTIGNSLRRIMLSSLDGVAVTSVQIDGVPHEFFAMEDVEEDVTEIVLNLKRLRLACSGELPRALELTAEQAGVVTAANIVEDGVTTVLNPELPICTLSADRLLRMEIRIDRGRGYRAAEQNKREDQPIGVIPVDSIFSPVERVRYEVEACRVGNITDYDQLVMEVWTDGRVYPQDALRQAALIMQEHLNVFQVKLPSEEDAISKELTEEEERMLETLCQPVDELSLSPRSKNCLKNAGIDVVGRILVKTEPEMLKHRNFGKKSLEEVRELLTSMNLSFGMDISENLLAFMEERVGGEEEEKEMEMEMVSKSEESEQAVEQVKE